MPSVYILKLSDGSYYVGSSSNLEKRLKCHNDKKVRSTRNKLPFEVFYVEELSTRGLAQSREYQIKGWKSRNAIEKLAQNKINGLFV